MAGEKQNRTKQTINSVQTTRTVDQTDSTILTGIGVGVLGSFFGEIYDSIASNTKATIKKYVEEKAQTYKLKFTRWIKWKLLPVSRKEIDDQPVCSLLKNLVTISRNVFLESISENDKKQKQFKKLFDTLWQKKYSKIGLEVYKDNWYAETLNLNKNVNEINKYFNQKSKTDHITLAKQQNLLKEIINKLKQIKSNKKIQDIVNEYEEFNKVKSRDMLNLEPGYGSEFLELKRKKIINKLKNFNIDQIILEDKIWKLNEVYKNDKALTKFISSNLPQKQRKACETKINSKVNEWKQQVTENYDCFNFVTIDESKKLHRGNSQSSTSSDSAISCESQNYDLVNDQSQKIELSSEYLQEKKFKQRAQDIEKEEEKNQQENHEWIKYVGFHI